MTSGGSYLVVVHLWLVGGRISVAIMWRFARPRSEILSWGMFTLPLTGANLVTHRMFSGLRSPCRKDSFPPCIASKASARPLIWETTSLTKALLRVGRRLALQKFRRLPSSAH